MNLSSIIARNDATAPAAPVPGERSFAPRLRRPRGTSYAFEVGGMPGLGGRPGQATSPAKPGKFRREFLSQVALLSRVELPILLRGGSRAEASTVAELLHRTSPRAGRPCAEIDCLSLHESALALELFGSEAATSPGTCTKVGLFERCHQGTVFLSEIVGLPSQWQARLLDLLDDQRLCRLGGSSWVSVDVRLVISTSMNVEWALATGELRTDLYYRMQGLGID